MDITNLQVDAYASGVTGIGGPLVRVTDLDTLPVPNENISLEFTMAASGGGGSVNMSYEQLTTTAVRTRIMEQASGIHGRVESLITSIAAIYAVSSAMSAPHTYADLVDIWDVIRDNSEDFQGFH